MRPGKLTDLNALVTACTFATFIVLGVADYHFQLVQHHIRDIVFDLPVHLRLR